MAEINRDQVTWDASGIDPGQVKWDDAQKPLSTMDRVRAQFTSEFSAGSNNPFSSGVVGRALAGVLGLPMQTAENVANLSRAAVGTVAGAAGFPDAMPGMVSLPGNVAAVQRGLSGLGLVTQNPDPTNAAYKAAEIAGGMAPFALAPGAAGQTALSTAGAIIGDRLAGPQGEMIGALLPSAASAALSGMSLSRTPEQQMRDTNVRAAQGDGFKFPPSETNPTLMNRTLEGWAGKLTTRQMASAQNSEVATRLAKRSMGIPENQPLTEGALAGIRQTAGQAYEAVKNFGAANNLRIRTDARFQNDVRGLGGDINAAIREFPEVVRVPQIEQLQQSLQVGTMTPTAAVELVKNLRFQAAENAKALGNPQSRALMSAQRTAADAVEGLIERTLSRSGQPKLYEEFRSARSTIARSHDIEAALNPATGTVNARVLSDLQDKGKYLGNELRSIAQAFKLSPRSMQTPESIGSQPGISPLDVGAGAIAAGSNQPGLASLLLARPAIRSLIMSDPYQRAFGSPAAPAAPPSALGALLRAQPAANQIIAKPLDDAPAGYWDRVNAIPR